LNRGFVKSLAAVLWRLTPPKNIFQDADFDGFAKQNHQNQRLEKSISPPKAAMRRSA